MAPQPKRIVYTAGTWDLFHIGHLNIIKKAFAEGDKLIVGVSTDELVESYKMSRPVIPLKDRMEIIRSLLYVDEVVVQEKLNDVNILKEYNINVVVIGSDWKTKVLPNTQWMKENNVELKYVDYTKNVSSTEIKNKIKKGWQEDKK